MLIRVYIGLFLFAFPVMRINAFPLWGNLRPGRYEVGYKTVFTFDMTRPPIVDASSTELRPAAPGRQMQISVWYPAKKSGNSPYLRFADYVSLSLRELNFRALTEARSRAGLQTFMQRPLANGASRQQLEALLQMQTASINNAAPANGLFPLVVFAHGSPWNQSIMCEYLASHGFIVAAVPSKGSFEYDFDVALSGLETLTRDIEFVIGVLQKSPQVDHEKLGLIGMSFGSAAVVAEATRNSRVGALISLDGGIGEGGVSFLLTRTPYYEVSRITAPLLHLYTDTNPHLDLTRLNSYKYSTRYFVRIPRMRHGDFVGAAMLENFVPKMFGPSPADAKSGFEWANRYSLEFLKAYLKNDAQALDFLRRPLETNEVPQDLLSISVKPAVPPPPTTREIKAIIQGGGVQPLVALYRERQTQDEQPFTQLSFTEVSDWLFALKQYDEDVLFSRLFVESYPNSVRAHYALGNVAKQKGDQQLAQNHFNEVLRLINDDPELDYRTRKRLEQTARQALLELK
jgi:hypothetical protein